MISHELGLIWICSDGKKFINKNNAIKHEQKVQEENQEIERLQEAFKQFP
tara:strand:+ start:18286 stop:18435 length:150 start_codon:yes stop_codon:yes gene_type:complete